MVKKWAILSQSGRSRRSFELNWTVMAGSGRSFAWKSKVRVDKSERSKDIGNNNEITVQCRPFAPFSFSSKIRFALRTVHFKILGDRPLSFFGLSSLAHNRPLSCLRTVHFNPLGPSTLTLSDRLHWPKTIHVRLGPKNGQYDCFVLSLRISPGTR